MDYEAIATDTLKWAAQFVKKAVTDIPLIGKRETSREFDYYLEHYSAKLDGFYGEKGSVLWRRACEGTWTLSVLKRYCSDVRKFKNGDWDKATEWWFPAFALIELGHIVDYRRRVEAGLIVPVTDESEPEKKPAKKAVSKKKSVSSEPWRAADNSELCLN